MKKLDEYIDMIYIQALSSLYKSWDEKNDEHIGYNKNNESKEVEREHLENYLKKRGYVKNTMLEFPLYTKDFTCVAIKDNFVEVWTDVDNNKRPCVIDKSLLTGLPITLNYYERI